MAEPHIRRARLTDTRAIVSILQRTFRDEDCVGRFLHPHLAQYPNDLRKFWRRALRNDWFDADHALMVVVNTNKKVVGYANWKLVGADSKRKSRVKELLKTCAEAHNSMSSRLLPNRAAADATAMTALSRAEAYYQHLLPSPRSELETLAVDPDHHRQGYGRLLVQWGLNGGLHDVGIDAVGGLPSSVMCAENTDEFYRKCGFTRMVGNSTEGEGNPLGGVAGGTLLTTPLPLDLLEEGEVSSDGQKGASEAVRGGGPGRTGAVRGPSEQTQAERSAQAEADEV